jgi:hypothetical protein
VGVIRSRQERKSEVREGCPSLEYQGRKANSARAAGAQ